MNQRTKEVVLKLLNSPSHEDNIIGASFLKEYTLKQVVELLNLRLHSSYVDRYILSRTSNIRYINTEYKLNDQLYFTPALQIVWFTDSPIWGHDVIIEL